MLKKIRLIVSVTFFALLSLYFLDFAELLPVNLTLLTKVQLVPALLALNTVVLIALLLFTLIFGRVYCSSICPMGVYQDTMSWIAKKRKKNKRYAFARAKTALRWTILGATLLSFLLGFTFLLGLLDPYGAYGRMATHVFRPAYFAGNNLLEHIFSSFGNYTFYKVSVYGLSVFSTIVALLTMLVIGFLAWKNGRVYCNTICPVGTLLGVFSRFALFKIQFSKSHCNACGLCAGKCKASCIDVENMCIDYSRCVVCFNCVDSCKKNAIKYHFFNVTKKKKSDTIPAYAFQKNTPMESRRRFLSATLLTGLAAGNIVARNVFPKKEVNPKIPIVPPGALSLDHLREKCIACHLCVSKCPSHVIKPAFLEHGIGGMMQPKLYFENGFCNYTCTVCTDVCPSGALIPLTKAIKKRTQIGQAHFVIENCLVYYNETNCGACSEHCPTQAIQMVSYKNALSIPHIATEKCVGCGGCEYVCPAMPHKAIYVEGVETQNRISLNDKE